MTQKQKKEKIGAIVHALKEIYPEALCSLEYEGEGWKLLVMGRLSAQCTDERVNIVCKDLFSVYPTPRALADAPIEDIERIVKPCGLYKMKASSIKAYMRKSPRGARHPSRRERAVPNIYTGQKSAAVCMTIYTAQKATATKSAVCVCKKLIRG